MQFLKPPHIRFSTQRLTLAHPSLVAFCNWHPQPSPHPQSGNFFILILHPRLHSWKDAPLSFDIVDLIEGNPQPKFILGFRILIE